MSSAAAVNWSTHRIHRRASVNAYSATAFMNVMHKEKGFGSLFRPSILIQAPISPD